MVSKLNCLEFIEDDPVVIMDGVESRVNGLQLVIANDWSTEFSFKLKRTDEI